MDIMQGQARITLNVKQQRSAVLWKSSGVDGHLSSPFTSEELAHAINS